MPKRGDVFLNLITNKDFRDWVLHPTKESNEYWYKWIKSNQAYQEEISKARHSILKVGFKEDLLSNSQLENMLTRIISQEKSGTTHRNNNQKRTFPWMSVAAGVIIILAGSFLFKEQINLLFSKNESVEVTTRTITNPAGQKSHIKLPDGSKVILNSNSSITFPQLFNSDKRIVSLLGEGFFHVREKDTKPFVVRVGQLEIEVLGTSFNINGFYDGPTVKIALVEGKIAVKENSKSNASILAPGEKLTYTKSNGSFQKTKYDPLAELGWKDGILYFKDDSFEEVIKKLEQWYGVQIQFEDNPKKDWRVNGQFNNDSLEEILKSLQFTYNLSYTIKGKHVVLTLKG